MSRILVFVGAVTVAVVALVLDSAPQALVAGMLIVTTFGPIYDRWVDPWIVRHLDRRLGRK